MDNLAKKHGMMQHSFTITVHRKILAEVKISKFGESLVIRQNFSHQYSQMHQKCI